MSCPVSLLANQPRCWGLYVKRADLFTRFNKSNAVLELPPGCSGQELLEGALDTISVDSEEYRSAKEEMRQVAAVDGLDAVLDGYDLDAVMCLGHGKHSLSSMSGAPIGEYLSPLCPHAHIPNTPSALYISPLSYLWRHEHSA